MEIIELVFFFVLTFTAVFTTINTIACIFLPNDFRFNAAMAAFSWAMVLTLLK